MARARGIQLSELETQLQALYQRVIAGDRTAPAELAELVWTTYGTRRTLVNALKSKALIRSDAEAGEDVMSIVGELAAKFVASVVAGTSTYESEKGPLGAYLQMAFHGDILNEAEKILRHNSNRQQLPDQADVGDDRFPWNLQEDKEDEVLDRIELNDRVSRFRDTLSPEDDACFDLMLREVRDTEPYAGALGITHLPIDQQRTTVNKIKDRLKKRLKRLP